MSQCPSSPDRRTSLYNRGACALAVPRRHMSLATSRRSLATFTTSPSPPPLPWWQKPCMDWCNLYTCDHCNSADECCLGCTNLHRASNLYMCMHMHMCMYMLHASDVLQAAVNYCCAGMLPGGTAAREGPQRSSRVHHRWRRKGLQTQHAHSIATPSALTPTVAVAVFTAVPAAFAATAALMATVARSTAIFTAARLPRCGLHPQPRPHATTMRGFRHARTL